VSDLQQAVSFEVSGLTGSYTLLAAIGIETEFAGGTLKIDQDALREAIATDPGALTNLFATADLGVVDRVNEVIDRYTESKTGIFEVRKDSLNQRIDTLQDRIDSGERRLDSYEQRLVRQFTALETLMVELQGSSFF
ncbi:MAG: flagellar filament capping protein FliD, partial [Myxococcales bacterium]|nr:flagellar filament capping protein FliD [Myxococcales bacterium]